MIKAAAAVLITFLALVSLAALMPVILVALIPVALMYALSRSTAFDFEAEFEEAMRDDS